jgi:hypothetical protein
MKMTKRKKHNYSKLKLIKKTNSLKKIMQTANSPTKQNETHYSLHVYTDETIIKQIYSHTKKFTMIRDKQDQDESFKVEDDVYIQNDAKSVTNSQIYANALFVYVKEEGLALGGTHQAGKENPNSNAATIYNDQLAYSMGISVGELILSAGLLGYKTGICSALDTKPMREVLGIKQNPKLLVGVGFPNIQLERTQHSEVLNKDVLEKFRTGALEEHWNFPTFKKYTKVTINGINT